MGVDTFDPDKNCEAAGGGITPTRQEICDLNLIVQKNQERVMRELTALMTQPEDKKQFIEEGIIKDGDTDNYPIMNEFSIGFMKQLIEKNFLVVAIKVGKLFKDKSLAAYGCNADASELSSKLIDRLINNNQLPSINILRESRPHFYCKLIQFGSGLSWVLEEYIKKDLKKGFKQWKKDM